jgi:hypothetical protein
MSWNGIQNLSGNSILILGYVALAFRRAFACGYSARLKAGATKTWQCYAAARALPPGTLVD